MEKKGNKLDRRNFLKTLGVVGAGSVLAAIGCKDKDEALAKNSPKLKDLKEYPQVPKRKLGKTGVQVPVLSHGIMYNLVENQVVLRYGLKWGISYWDSANSYAGGNSELGIGKFLKKSPEMRKKLFIVSKASRASNIDEVEERLQTSLKRLNTSYIDLYYGVHALSDPSDLTDALRKWAESAKKRKLIRHFGFSTHKNMAKCLMAASKLDWIDAVMTTYNFRVMQEKDMQEAVEACHKANIGLVAMKIQGMSISSSGDKKLTDHFLKKGFTEGQAKIMAVLADKRISAACVTMENTGLITQNAAAVLERADLSKKDMKMLKQFACDTKGDYCAGCADICDRALPGDAPYTSDIMRYLMYYNSYGDKDKARELFREIPYDVRKRLTAIDYTRAETMCPQGLRIGRLVAEAVEKLS